MQKTQAIQKGWRLFWTHLIRSIIRLSFSPTPPCDEISRARPATGRGNLLSHLPVAYPDLVSAVLRSRGVITDSGGLQKEAFLLRVPCTTVRTETEWVETVELGWNKLVEPGPELVAAASREHPPETTATPYGDGHAADAVVQALIDHLPAS